MALQCLCSALHCTESLKPATRPSAASSTAARKRRLVWATERLEVLAQDGEWLEIRTRNGLQCWVKRKNVVYR